MDRLGKVWNRISTRRSVRQPNKSGEEIEDENSFPDTKKEVFELFSKPARRHRPSAASNASVFDHDDLIKTPRTKLSVNSALDQHKRPSIPRRRSVSPHRSVEFPSDLRAERSAPVNIINLRQSPPDVFANPSSLSSVTSQLCSTSPSPVSELKTSPAPDLKTSPVPDPKTSPAPEIKTKRRSNESVSRLREDAATAKANSRELDVFGSSTSPTLSSDQFKQQTKRRSSVFVKRGSVSMEPIKRVDLDEVYSVYKQVRSSHLGTGRFGYIKLAEHKESKCKIAIKLFPRPQTKQVDFIREYNYSFFLSPHPNIIDTYEGMFQTNDDSAFFFVQEICPCASLREAVEASPSGIGEVATRAVMSHVMAAIEFMHNENLVHRNLKAENILIFDAKEFTRVKVTDFGLTRKVDSAVKYLEYVNNYHAPELCETVVNEVLTVNRSIDIWAIGIIFYYCLKGRFPWQKATIMCKPYWEWEQWLKRKNPQLPKRWEPFSERSLKLLKKTLNPRYKDRWSAKDVRKCIAKEKLLKTQKVSEEG